MTTIRLFADDQDLKVVAKVKLAAGNKKSVALQVKFSPEWDGYTPSAVFFRSTAPDDIYEMLLTEGRCTIPHEVLADAGELVIGIRGATPDAVKVSDRIKYTVVDGAPTGTATAQGPTPDVYQQILARLYELETPEKGDPGEPGYTPQRGVDYWTTEDQRTMVADVLDALPTWDGGAY